METILQIEAVLVYAKRYMDKKKQEEFDRDEYIDDLVAELTSGNTK